MIVPPPAGAEAAALARAVTDAIADPAVDRLVVAPPDDPAIDADVFLSKVLGVLMRHERLDVEIGYAAPRKTRMTKIYGLPHGEAGRTLAETGTAADLPLIRDDAATVLVGQARHLGSGDERLHGETYVDSDRIFDGEVRGVLIEPLPREPGVRARVERRSFSKGWREGRAVQTGGTNLIVEREGVLWPRVVKRSTFYRHHLDWKLVR